MADTKNKVTYGLSNVHIWPITATSDAGKPTYGTMFTMPGAVELSLDAEGSSDANYGDDVVYFQGVANSGYSGKLSVYDIPDDFLTNILGETKDANGVMVENSDVTPSEFAMAFEFKGDAKKRRHLLYRCTASRPSLSSKTKEDKIEPNTPELEFTALPRLDTHNVKAHCEESDAGYADWYGTAPYEISTTSTTTTSTSS